MLFLMIVEHTNELYMFFKIYLLDEINPLFGCVDDLLHQCCRVSFTLLIPLLEYKIIDNKIQLIIYRSLVNNNLINR